MKILHTADWHLGKTIAFTNFDLLPLQEKVLRKIVTIAEKESVDMAIIAGDIFDSANPSGKAERLLTTSLKKLADLGCPVLITAGNHDSPERLSALNPLAQENLIFIAGFVKEDFSGIDIKKGRWRILGSGRFLLFTDRENETTTAVQLLPYASEYRLGEVFYSNNGAHELEYADKVKELMNVSIPFDADHRVLISHLFVTGGKSKTKEEKPLFIGGSYLVPSTYFPDSYDYVALGHLHSAQKISPTIAYSGSILPLIPNPGEEEKYVQIIEFNDKTALKRIPLDLKKIIEMRVVNSIDEALKPIHDDRTLYLYFQAIDSPLTSNDLRDLTQVHGDQLAAIRVELTDVQQSDDSIQIADAEELSPEEWFRKFYVYKRSEEPPAEVMDLYRRLIIEEEDVR